MKESSPKMQMPSSKNADSWLGLQRLVAQMETPFDHKWQPPIDWLAPRNKIEPQWLALVDRHERVCDALIDSWLTKKEVSEDDQEAVFVLRCRLFAAKMLLEYFTFRKSGVMQTAIPFPSEMSDEDLLRWLLLDWWRAKGSLFALSCLRDAAVAKK